MSVVGFAVAIGFLVAIHRTGVSTVDLQFARDTKVAKTIVRHWGPHSDQARKAVLLDIGLIPSYTVALAALAIWVGGALSQLHRDAWRVAWVVVSLTVLGALCDVQEDFWLWWQLYPTTKAVWWRPADLAGATFLVSTCKFALLSIVGAVELAGVIDWIRVWTRPDGKRRGDRPPVGDFEGLYRLETNSLGGASKADIVAKNLAVGDEPWVAFTTKDRVGLALSGGGIRSATFNLGLLQGLANLDLLHLIDYLATVSGGGYIGGWWTAWLHRRTQKNRRRMFPVDKLRAGHGAPDAPEPEAIRHLREFSMFLVPRWGLFETEMWNGFVAVLSGAALALFASACVAFLILSVWVLLGFLLWSTWFLASATSLAALTAGVLFYFERSWESCDDAEPEEFKLSDKTGRLILVAAPAVLVGLGWVVTELLARRFDDGLLRAIWLEVPKAEWYRDHWNGLFWIFAPAAAWMAASLIVIMARVFISRRGSDKRDRNLRAAFDRVLGRLWGLSLVWSLGSLAWLAARYWDGAGLGVVITAAFGSGGLSAWLARQISRTSPRPATASLPSKIRRTLPGLLAYVALALVAVVVARGIDVVHFKPLVYTGLLGCAVMALYLLAWLWDSKHFGLHEFYSDRIARTYLGASNPEARTAAANRQTDRREKDDVNLTELTSETLPKAQCPIHLVCCAANMLADDTLDTLGRGARSAVLSPLACSIGNAWARPDNLRLGSALTASAAAFNSNMGSVSRRLGPAVTFLMCAFNLRLGLWVRHPLCTREDHGWLPGLLFFREMFQRTSCQALVSDGKREPTADDVHLSDGAHFENLALYELVRRHCRYIIVSDCGADVESAFDDFGNAVRRVREDFGVEIQVDLEPLRPNAQGISRQHMVVGTIHYDRDSCVRALRSSRKTARANDKGILLYFKTSLTGDEPTDIGQYKVRNPAFPHESTGDQFYDEAQWEAYRRLGEHAVHAALRFWDPASAQGSHRDAAKLFADARAEWYPTPSDLAKQLERHTALFSDLERQLRTEAPRELVRELFPELQAIANITPTTPTEGDVRCSLHFVLQAMRLMENVYSSCYLDTHADHPLNVGWLNVFQRWAYTPTFRFWWPVIKPLFGSGVRQYVEQRLFLSKNRAKFSGVVQPAVSSGPAYDGWSNLKTPAANTSGAQTCYGYDLTLQDGNQTRTIQVGVAIVEHSGTEVWWRSNDFFILPGLWGAGIGTQFLDDLIQEFKQKKPKVETIRIVLERTLGDGRSAQAYADLISFYTCAGFWPRKASGTELIKQL
ncbi:MAG TPA: hypothetical protein VHZ24_19315 [Pirellulales bacterium]|nr:hypothetical protein [Pirellulales bacterium]